MEVNEAKKKKNNSVIIAIIAVVAIIGLYYLGAYLYANYLVKYYKEETDKLVPLAQSYVKSNENYYGVNIFDKLDKNKKVTDGLIYVNENSEVALAIIYDDAVCYVKYYNSDEYIDNIKPDYCQMFLNIHIANYDKNNDSNEQDNNINNDTNNNNNNDNNNDNKNEEENDNVIEHVAFDIKFNNGDKVSNIKLNIKVNGKATTDYSYDYFHIYKVNNNDYNTCDISSTHTKLSNNYVLKSTEKYVVEFKELKVKNMKFASWFSQVENTVSVNGGALEKLNNYCAGSEYEDGRSLSFSFELPALADNDNNSVVDNPLVTELYNKYIKYSVETSDYKNMNVNNSSSDVYLIKHAIYNILKDNKVNIEEYNYNSDALSNDNLDLYKYGYKITISQIKQYISKNFNINRDIDFNKEDLNFACDSNITEHYDSNEKAYKLINSNGPWSVCSSEGVYSKITNYETSGNSIIIYTDYLLADYEMSGICIRNSADNPLTCDKDIWYNETGTIDGCDGTAKACVLDKYSNYVGKFKHTFTKKTDGNYYWVSTQKIN